MKGIKLEELEMLLAKDEEFLAAERELRTALNLANDVTVFRVEAGLTQMELARAVGTNQANISRLESALANPTLSFLKRIARAFNAELDIRLRRHEDVAGSETLQSTIARLDARTATVTRSGTVFAPMMNEDLFVVNTGAGPRC